MAAVSEINPSISKTVFRFAMSLAVNLICFCVKVIRYQYIIIVVGIIK